MIPVVKKVQTDWVIGWKAATPYVRDSGELVFMPLVCRGVPYSVDDTAICYRAGHNNPPHDNCHCGFNAWDEPEQAIHYAMWGGHKTVAYQGPHKLPLTATGETLAILRVGLYGDIIDTRKPRWGYRAERQRVADMFVNDVCALCERHAAALGVMNATYPLSPRIRQTAEQSFLLWSVCTDHARLARHIVDPSGLTRHNNVKIHWGYPPPSKSDSY